MTEVEKTQANIDQALRMAVFAVDGFVLDHRDQLAACTAAAQTNLTVRAALAYLLGRGLVHLASAEQWDQFLPIDVPEPFLTDLTNALHEAMAQQVRINASVNPRLYR